MIKPILPAAALLAQPIAKFYAFGGGTDHADIGGILALQGRRCEQEIEPVIMGQHYESAARGGGGDLMFGDHAQPCLYLRAAECQLFAAGVDEHAVDGEMLEQIRQRAPDMARPQTGHNPTQRRVDMLAIEQNAWVLAARDPRCVVMATRTEIDWAVKRGQMMVWAPSKLVLDAVDGPQSRDPVALALWLAEMMAAAGIVVHGDVAVPAGSRVPVERAPS